MQQTTPIVCCTDAMHTRLLVTVLVTAGIALPGRMTCASVERCVRATPERTCCCVRQSAAHPCCSDTQLSSVEPACGCAPVDHADQAMAPARVDEQDRRPLMSTSSPASATPDPASDAGDPGRSSVGAHHDTGPPPLLASCVLRL